MSFFWCIIIANLYFVTDAASGVQGDQVNVMTYNVKSGKDFLGQTCCWDVPQVVPGSDVPATHTRMKQMQWMLGLLKKGEVEAIMIQESVDGKLDGSNSRCSDVNGMLEKMGVADKVGAVYVGDAVTGERGKPGHVMGFNCVGIIYNKQLLSPVSSKDAPLSVGYDDIPGRDNNAIGKFFPAEVKPLCLGTSSDKEDRFMGAWLFERNSDKGVNKLILASGNWPNEKDGLVAQQKIANGITLTNAPDPTGMHFQAMLDFRKTYGDVPIIMGFDFNNEMSYVVDNMANFAKGKTADKVVVSEDMPTCCPDIVRNHGPEVITPKRDGDGKIIPNEYDFSPRKEPFTDMKPFQAGRKFAFDHIACVGCDSIFVNGPQPTDNSVTGPFGWTPYTEIGTDPASWKLLNSAEHAPLAGSVAFINPLKAPPPPPAPSASKDAPKRTSRESSKATSKETSKDTSKETSKDASKSTSKETSKAVGKESSEETSKESSKAVADGYEILSSASSAYVYGAILLVVVLAMVVNCQQYKRRTRQYSPLLDDVDEEL